MVPHLRLVGAGGLEFGAHDAGHMVLQLFQVLLLHNSLLQQLLLVDLIHILQLLDFLRASIVMPFSKIISPAACMHGSKS